MEHNAFLLPNCGSYRESSKQNHFYHTETICGLIIFMLLRKLFSFDVARGQKLLNLRQQYKEGRKSEDDEDVIEKVIIFWPKSGKYWALSALMYEKDYATIKKSYSSSLCRPFWGVVFVLLTIK